MRAVIQRVTKASVSVNGKIINEIGRGLCVLVGINRDDTIEDLQYIARKILNLRFFDNDNEKRWDKSVKDKGFEVLCISQFTLYTVLKGNKLDFHCAMEAERSKAFYEQFLDHIRGSYIPEKIKDGEFGAHMQVDISNDGPVTVELESPSSKRNEK